MAICPECGGDSDGRCLSCHQVERAQIIRRGPGKKSDVERATAQAYSDAADTACNAWNLLERTPHWAAMTEPFEAIWRNLKAISGDHHKRAEELECRGQ